MGIVKSLDVRPLGFHNTCVHPGTQMISKLQSELSIPDMTKLSPQRHPDQWQDCPEKNKISAENQRRQSYVYINR